MSFILGLDPGLATVGFGLIERTESKLRLVDFGVIKTPPSMELGERLFIIKSDLEQLLKDYKPSVIGLEELFFAKNVTNAIKVAHARGVLVELLYEYKIPIYHFTPLQVKNNIAGTGTAEKWQVQEMVKRHLNLSFIPRPDDAADALAIALCAERMMVFKPS